MGVNDGVRISLLTGGGDRPYVMGMGTELIRKGVGFDLIGSDGLDSPEWHVAQDVRFLNLRGDQKADADLGTKVIRILAYYMKLIRYAWGDTPKVFHLLWNNKFEYFDRTLLMLYYKALGKRVVLTAHNINKRKRDSTDSILNRLTLMTQYRLCDHIFVHTEKMKRELTEDFGANPSGITVIPFGINNAVPNTNMTSREARQRLGLGEMEQVILFFGRIAAYKGLEFLVDAYRELASASGSYRLIIAGRPDNDSKQYCAEIQEKIKHANLGARVIQAIEFVPDAETEVYFKAADVLVLPYRDIYQSGVLFLAYSFGLPVVATNVGGLSEEIVEGKTGFVCHPDDPKDLERTIVHYFDSELYENLCTHRGEIMAYARGRYSWDVVGQSTACVYARLAE
jgi:D-inositol-3-phosphate glycosyltransferase